LHTLLLRPVPGFVAIGEDGVMPLQEDGLEALEFDESLACGRDDGLKL
jgi:hypothetical protein